MTDVTCIKTDGNLMVRECVYRKLLDMSRECWLRHDVEDWGAIDAEVWKIKADNQKLSLPVYAKKQPFPPFTEGRVHRRMDNDEKLYL